MGLEIRPHMDTVKRAGSELPAETVCFFFGLFFGLFFFHGFRRRFLGILPAVHSFAHGMRSSDVRGDETAGSFQLFRTIHQSK